MNIIETENRQMKTLLMKCYEQLPNDLQREILHIIYNNVDSMSNTDVEFVARKLAGKHS